MTSFVFFADCGTSAGLGHIRRCAALAAALIKQDQDCSFNAEHDEARAFLRDHLPDMPHADYSANGLPADTIMVMDSYTLPNDRYEVLCKQATQSVLIDDLSDRSLHCDIHLNHNIFAEAMNHAKITASHRLLGPRYFLVDAALPPLRHLAQRDGILITFGGTDDGRMAAQAARAIRDAGVTATLILAVSPLCDVHASAAALLREDSSITVQHGAVMAELMKQCRLYVGGAGQTNLEALSAGLSITIVQTADNQAANISALAEYGEAVFPRPDWHTTAEAAARCYHEQPASRLATVLDGKGPTRAATAIIDVISQALT